MKILIIFSLIIVLLLPLTACSSGTYGEGYNVGFDEGYSKGWQEGYEKGFEDASISLEIQTPSSPQKSTPTLGKITLEDAEYVLNILPLVSGAFDMVDPAGEGMSNADMALGDDFSEVQLFILDEPFQMIYGVMAIIDSRIERASFDTIMNDETMISDLLIENIKAGAIEEGFELGQVDINISYPDLGDSAFLGEGFMAIIGLSIGVEILWFRYDTVFVMLQSVYYSPERENLLPIAEEIEVRIMQYSQ